MWPIRVFLGHQIGQGVFQKWRVPWIPSKTLMMELKGASVVVMVVILLITGNAIADDPCFQQCLNNCDQLPVLCVRLCLGKCPPDPNLPQNPVDLSHYYCKIGCSLHQCHKFSHEYTQNLGLTIDPRVPHDDLMHICKKLPDTSSPCSNLVFA
ncbi:PREDICTED: TAP1 [Prunus dulcis]|uniref:PREDICTED: TAP1 n=1 Tax=Prunus dulcis TaxID=3755 RepID=A0A5E4GA61_PRUDU|nr:PREDICTED: TAP1 [Prunus dulcis]